MTDGLYISRQLAVADKSCSEYELLGLGSVFVVLAEPGAGKTELLSRLASLLGVAPIRASIFRNRAVQSSPALVIDGLDEVARIDKLAMDAIITKALDADCEKVVLAGRSSEWDNSRTQYVKDCFGKDPIVVRLEPFNAKEQRQLFEAKFPGEDFDRFVEEAGRMELGGLLGNPQFLQLFGAAYIESGHVFTSKPAIFSDAVRRLAHETNTRISSVGRPALARILALGDEMFAKLLLCGASGVSTVESLVDRDYPYLSALISEDGKCLTDTRLLKPSDDPEKHEPVHRIVAEYCAARYLAGRVDDATDRLSLPRLLSIIAPSRIVRAELRGMVGWMAALSGERSQLELIDLDPYAVFANGDPSALSSKAKRRLLARLNEISREDPYFRRSDVWRRFNVGQFFTPDIHADVRAILAPGFDNILLRDLVIELISSSKAAAQFSSDLRRLALERSLHKDARRACFLELIDVAPNDAVADVPLLLAENTIVSLDLAARAAQKLGAEKIGRDTCIELLRKFAGLYPPRETVRSAHSLYFIKFAIQELDLTTVRDALDHLTDGLACTCNPKTRYRCDCRVGISKVAGALLDRYFEMAIGPHDPVRIRQWTKALRFEEQLPRDRSASVDVLVGNDGLRRAVQWLAVSGRQTARDAQEAIGELFTAHSGIGLNGGDMEEIARQAFVMRDIPAWTAVWTRHDMYGKTRKPHPLRSLQRSHAKQDPALMSVWGLRERQAVSTREERYLGFRRRRRRIERREAEAELESRAQFIANRAEIAAGEFDRWNSHFAQLFLLEPQRLADDPHYGETPIEALRNCLAHLKGPVPSLRDLSAHKGSDIAQILLAHCILRFRDGLSLDELDPAVLQAAWTETGSWPTFKDEDERASFDAALERAVLADPSAVSRIVVEFIEPALVSTAETPTNVGWLKNNTKFHGFLQTKPTAWLRKYPSMPLNAMESLFKMAVKHGDRAALADVIDQRLADPVADSGKDTEDDKRAARRHRFWTLNAFFFNTEAMETAWDELKRDRMSLLAIHDLIGWRRADHIPPLSAEAIYRILDAFIHVWPRVHLPSSYGTRSPPAERAYRFLHDIVWRIGDDAPSQKLPVIERLLSDTRFGDFRDRLLTLRVETLRQIALRDFRAPTPTDVSALLDRNQIASIEDLRALLVEELNEIQKWLKGSETDPLDMFYDGGRRVDENTGRNRVVELLNARMTALGMSIVIEHHMSGGNRCDFTATSSVTGARVLLVVEVKGQWHSELYSAASAQLSERYSIHPDAAGQGIYLVFWFGQGETVAGRVDPAITSPTQLREAIVARMPDGLKAVIDVVVLDLSKPRAK